MALKILDLRFNLPENKTKWEVSLTRCNIRLGQSYGGIPNSIRRLATLKSILTVKYWTMSVPERSQNKNKAKQ